jgi:hypothetical protein
MYCGGGHLEFSIGIKNRNSETTWTIETKLPRNGHWKVLYNFFVFQADRKSKMALCIAVAAILDFRSA